MTQREILGVRFDGVTLDEAVSQALEYIAVRKAAYVCTPNPEIVWECRKNSALRRAVLGADMVLPDGVGVVWASRVLGAPLPQRVTGYDFLLALLERLEGTVFLLGGQPGVAEDAAGTIAEKFPAVTVVGCMDGYFTDGDAAVKAVASAAPDLLLVCLGSPKQELWMAENKDRLPVGLMAGLGGCLDVLSGHVRRAPQGWIRLHLEWLYRLLQQPRRIRRQLRLPLFVLAVLAQRIKKTGLR